MNPLSLLLTIFYYIVVGIISLMSIFTVYTLLRYGASRGFSFFLSGVFIFIFLTALAGSYQTLQLVI